MFQENGMMNNPQDLLIALVAFAASIFFFYSTKKALKTGKIRGKYGVVDKEVSPAVFKMVLMAHGFMGPMALVVAILQLFTFISANLS